MHKILQWNLQGYRSKYEDLTNLLQKYNPAAAIIQETMLAIPPPRAPRGYTIFCDYNGPTPGNGVATLIRRDIPHSRIDLQTRLQATAFRIGLTKQYTLCNIYISPQYHLQLNEITNLIDQLPQPIIIGGDFNSRHPMWDNLCNRSDARSITIENALLTTPNTIMNNGDATHFHVQTGSSSALDLSICSADILEDMRWFVEDDLNGSDHYPIIIEEIEREQYIPQERYLEHRANWRRFEKETIMGDTDDLLQNMNVNELVEHYNQHIITAANKTIPKSTRTLPRRKRVPWWTQECSNAISARKTALRRYQRSLLVTDKIEYCRLRAKAKRVLHEARVDSWRDFVGTLNCDTPMSKIWKRISKIRGKYDNLNMPCIIKNERHVTDKHEIAEIMAQHYEKISSNDNYSPQFNNIRNREEQIINFDTDEDLQYNSPLTLLELKRMISHSKKTATGEDSISYNMIKRSHESSQQFLVSIMNKIFSSGSYPTLWRSSTILSFPKPGKPPTKEENYRPISLTSCVGKTMEKMLNHRLTILLETMNLLPKQQFGFRKMQGTTDALNRFVSDVSNNMTNKYHTICVSFDMMKAYDTTWRFGILRCLNEMGIRGKLPTYIQNFLSSRTFKTKIGTASSADHRLEQGVPQGSVLSCTLFSIAINGILQAIPHTIQASLYVDDLLIYGTGPYLPTLERRMQCAINKIQLWSHNHGFSFSAPKTNCIHFHRLKANQPPLLLTLNRTIIPNRDSITFLGMTIDNKLNWKEHIRKLKLNCIKRLDLLKCLSHTTWGSDRVILLRVYRAIIRSKIDYGSFIYKSARENVIKCWTLYTIRR